MHDNSRRNQALAGSPFEADEQRGHLSPQRFAGKAQQLIVVVWVKRRISVAVKACQTPRNVAHLGQVLIPTILTEIVTSETNEIIGFRIFYLLNCEIESGR